MAQGRQAGLSRRRLRGPDLTRPTRGMRIAAAEAGLPLRCAALQAALPSRRLAFAQVTAVRLLGLPTPAEWDCREPIHVVRETSAPPVQRTGAADHAGLERRRTVVVAGLSVVAAVDTWADLAVCWGVADLVALGDAIVNTQGVAVLAAVVEGRAGARGVVRLRQVLDLVRSGSASAMESRTRLAMRAWGLPEPELNVPVTDSAGKVLGRPDFVWRQQRVVAEYEGDHHRVQRAQWEYDVRRHRAFEAGGWRVVRVTHRALTHEAERVAVADYLHNLLRS